MWCCVVDDGGAIWVGDHIVGVVNKVDDGVVT